MAEPRCVTCHRAHQPGLATEAGWMCRNCLWTGESEDIVRRSQTPAAFAALADEVASMDTADVDGAVRSELTAGK